MGRRRVHHRQELPTALASRIRLTQFTTQIISCVRTLKRRRSFRTPASALARHITVPGMTIQAGQGIRLDNMRVDSTAIGLRTMLLVVETGPTDSPSILLTVIPAMPAAEDA